MRFDVLDNISEAVAIEKPDCKGALRSAICRGYRTFVPDQDPSPCMEVRLQEASSLSAALKASVHPTCRHYHRKKLQLQNPRTVYPHFLPSRQRQHRRSCGHFSCPSANDSTRSYMQRLHIFRPAHFGSVPCYKNRMPRLE